MKLRLIALVFTLALVLGTSAVHGQTWNLQIVDDAGDTGYDSQIAVTSAGIPYIFYKNNSTNGLYLAWWVPDGGGAGGWQFKSLDTYLQPGYPFEVLVDAQDRFHVAWSRYTSPTMKYGIYDPVTANWVLGPESIAGGLSNAYVDLTLVQAGADLVPVVAANQENAKIFVFKRNPGTGVWTSSQVDYLHDATRGASIAVDSAQNMHLSYYENDGDNLMYATKAWDATTWQISIVDLTGNVGDYSSIAVDSGDRVHIVYYDTTNGDLKYATLNP